jgi:RimJ/RimL family protein N-acetyltransferase
MGTTIETERLRLRPFAPADLDGLVELYRDPEVTRFLGERDRDDLIGWLEESAEEWERLGYGRMGIFDRAGERFLGRGGLRCWPELGETEVSWALRADARGRGLATEAARGCIEWGFANFDFPYVTAMVRPDNARSLAVVERLGMSPLREDRLFGAELVVYAISRGDDGRA